MSLAAAAAIGGALLCAFAGLAQDEAPGRDGRVKLTGWIAPGGSVVAFFDSTLPSLDAGEVGAALHESIGVPPAPLFGDSDRYYFSGPAEARFVADAFERRWRVDPAPIGAILGRAGFRELEIECRFPAGGADRNDWAAYSWPIGGFDVEPSRFAGVFVDLRSPSPPAAFEVVFGYSNAEADRLLAFLAAVPVAGAPLAFLFHRLGRRAVAAGRREAWEGAAARLRALRYAAWLALAAAFAFGDGVGIAGYAAAPGAGARGAAGVALLLLGGPGLSILAGLFVSDLAFRAAAARLDGARRFRIQLALLSRVVLPLGFLSLAVLGVAQDRPRLAALAFLLVFVSRIASDLALVRFAAISFHEISSGALRERLTELAAKAGVVVRRFTLVSADRFDFSNAFAVSHDQIFVTNGLLAHLNRREVDAVAAHELTHLRRRHLRGLRLASLLAAAAIVLAAGLVLRDALLAGAPLVLVVGVEGALLVHFAVARRFEFAADAGAVELTGDLAGVLSYNSTLARLGALPFECGPLARLLSTHPSPNRRIAALERAGAPAGAVTSAIDTSARYAEEAALGTAARIHSTPLLLKLGRLRRLALVLLAAGVPALAAAAAFSPASSSAAASALLALGAAASAVLYFAVENAFPARSLARIEERLRAVLAPPPGAIFVGLAPDSQVRLYDGFHDWDAGFLEIEDGAVAFTGERVRFLLPREDVLAVERGPRPAGWFRARRIVVRFRGGAGDAPREFSLAPLGEKTVLRAARGTADLASRLSAWHSGRGISSRPAAPPAFPRVASLAPRDFRLARTVVPTVLAVAACAALATIVAGVPRDSWGRAIPYAAATAAAVTLLRYVPFWRSRGD